MLWTTIATEAVVIFLLIIVNGLLAMSEMAIVSSRKVRLQQLAENGSVGAKVALGLLTNPSNFLASIQIGITLIGIFAGAFGGATIAEELARQFVKIPALSTYSDAIGLGVVVVFVTILSLIVGELLPKRLALSNAERVATIVARPIRVLSLVSLPAVKFLSWATEGLLKIAGATLPSDPPVTEEEVKIMIEQGTEAGVFEKEEESMMKRVISFGDRRVGDLMTQRLKIVTLNVNAPFEQNLKTMLATPHSYFPVYDNGMDGLLGVVSVKCLLKCMAESKLVNTDIRKCIFEPLFVPESMRALNLLERFKRSGKHLALVLDEYGGTAGIVTIVDVLEALVGDLPDEKKEDHRIVKREDGSFLVDGALSVHDLSDLLNVKDIRAVNANGEFQTMGGFMMANLGHIPKEGESFLWRGHRFEIVDMDGHRVDKVLIEMNQAALQQEIVGSKS